MNRFTFLHHILAATIAALLFISVPEAKAFDTSVYADSSRLSQGRWMKVTVSGDGLYFIPSRTLRGWGFGDISKVQVYGYGGRRLPDRLAQSEYRDDLPPVQTIRTDDGIIFYGLGAGEWVTSGSQTYYNQNDFSSTGSYFVGEISDGEALPEIEKVDARPDGSSPGTTDRFPERLHHELEQTAVPGEAGPLLLGEEFRYTRSRSISFSTPGACDGTVRFYCSFMSNLSSTGTLSFTVNGEKVPATTADRVSAKSSSSYVHGVITNTWHEFTAADNQAPSTVQLGISLGGGGTVSSAYLNFVSLSYDRRLSIPAEGYLQFYPRPLDNVVSGVAEGARILDVTDPTAIVELEPATENGTMTISSRTAGRTLVVWNPGARLPSPTSAGYVTNQNLHADRDIDMVIIAPAVFTEQALRLARLHTESEDSLTVSVVTPEAIYNEFSSGTQDVGAFRRYFKMLYDRGNSSGRPLRYAILMGRTTTDNRGLSTTAPTYPTLPSWMPREIRASVSDNEGYCTDDISAMLEDNSGTQTGTDKLSIAIGRIPVLSADEAKNIVDKAYQYAEGARKTAWKHRFMFLAEDQDNGVHLTQTENMLDYCTSTERQQHLIRKVYMDAYPVEGDKIPEARAAMFRYLDEGVVWWNFIGHANTTGWTKRHQLQYTDIKNMYLRHWPFIYAATCNFMRLDGSSISGGELLYKERYGGAIGIVSAVRPVYIKDNGDLSAAFGRALAKRDASGRFLTPGEIYRTAKNDVRDALTGSPLSDTNRLRYTFIGDPALRLATPSNIARLDSIAGKALADDDQPTLEALSQVKATGSITDPDGNLLSNFNGVVLIEIFDAERSVTTLGNGGNGSIETFEDTGSRIYCGAAEVRGGKFSLTISMPEEVTQNFRPATMSLYAYSTEDDTEAVGLNRSFYVYGYDDNAANDDTAPVIESFVLNHSTFRSGDTVNPSPMIIASISDDTGLNVSSAGIGHQMTATLDGTGTYTDLSYYFTPSSDGTPSGVINYPLEDLQEGNHTLSLRIWDTAGNSATSEIEFYVESRLAPKIYEVYTDANPASTEANFYLSHDQPDNMVTVDITVYNLLGRPVWSGSSTGRSDMFLSVPVTWDLTDKSGRRVARGIYLYRATITSDGESYETASRKIAVTAQ